VNVGRKAAFGHIIPVCLVVRHADNDERASPLPFPEQLSEFFILIAWLTALPSLDGAFPANLA
jgi:uncharacterized membrane protein YagU involved in acid resistance